MASIQWQESYPSAMATGKKTVVEGRVHVGISTDGNSFRSLGTFGGLRAAYDPAVVRLPDGSYFLAYKSFMNH